MRQPVLRPGRPPEECIFEGDTTSSTLHLGAFLGYTLVGVASFMKNKHSHFNEPEQYQLRGMAVLPEYQNKKLGEKLLLEGEKRLIDQASNVLIWFNARESAIDFYKRYGYKTTGELFMIPNVCKHIVMYKNLVPRSG